MVRVTVQFPANHKDVNSVEIVDLALEPSLGATATVGAVKTYTVKHLRETTKGLEILAADYALVEQGHKGEDAKLTHSTEEEERELAVVYPTEFKAGHVILQLKLLVKNQLQVDAEEKTEGNGESLTDLTGSMLNQNALNKRSSLITLGGQVRRRSVHSNSVSENPIPKVTAESKTLQDVAEEGEEHPTSPPPTTTTTATTTATATATATTTPETARPAETEGKKPRKSYVIGLKMDVATVAQVSKRIIACYKAWEVEEGAQLCSKIIPVLVHMRGEDYPLVKKLKQMAEDFNKSKRVRFMLTSKQSLMERNKAKRELNRSRRAQPLLALSVTEIELKLHLKTLRHTDTDGEPKSLLKASARLSSKQYYERKVREASLHMEMKYGSYAVKLKAGQPTDRWFSINKTAEKLCWRKASGSEKSKGKKGGFSFSKGREREIADIEAIFYGPYASNNFADSKGEPWLCMSVDFGTLPNSDEANTVDMVFKDDKTLTTWFLGLQSLTTLNNSYMSRGRLLWQRVIFKLNHLTVKELAKRLGKPYGRLWTFDKRRIRAELS